MITGNASVSCHTLTITNVTASSDDGNIPTNTIDDNLATRWSAEGDGQWIEYNLGTAKTVRKLRIAFYKGNERIINFDILVSTDRNHWTTVFSGRSSGSTLQQEEFSIKESLAKYVRIVGHGNSVNDWISITEVDITDDTLSPPANFTIATSASLDGNPPPSADDSGTTSTTSFLQSVPQSTTFLSQGSITWQFSTSVEYGKFATGDYYVICPSGCTITSISPEWNGTENGSMLNPTPGKTHGFHASAPGYSADLNVAASLPLSIKPGDIVISTTGRTPGSNKSYVNEAAILTVVEKAPPAGSFRPGYCDPSRTIYNTSQLNYSLLENLPPTPSAPSPDTVAELFARPWTGEHLEGYKKRYIHPANNMPDYGREIARDIGTAALTLHLDYTNKEKQQLLINFIQLGIDLYSIVKSGGSNVWSADGGHASGRKWPILFAGLMLNDDGMKNIGMKSGDYALEGAFGSPPPDYIHFGEDDQTFYVTQDDIDITNSPSWNPDPRGGNSPYTSSLLEMPEWGIRHASHPELSDAAWSATYRTCCTAIAWSGFILAARIMKAKELWNHDALFDYQDRYMAITSGKPDPFGYTVPEERAGNRTNSVFIGEMWDTYRSKY